MTDICIEKYIFLCVSRQCQPTASAASADRFGSVSQQHRRHQPTASTDSVSRSLWQRQLSASAASVGSLQPSGFIEGG